MLTRDRAAWLLATVLIVVAGSASADPALARPSAPLRHDGRWFVDAKGRTVVLRGFNMVYKVGDYRPESAGFGADDARFLRRQGFNTIRLGVIYKGLEPTPPGADQVPHYDDAYLDSIARTEAILAHKKIHTLLDFHQDLYNERFEGEGWPDWAVRDDGLPAEPQNGFPGNYLGMQALNRAFDHFWANDPAAGRPLQDAYAAAWQHVARRFRNHRWVFGYDILNEPWPGSQWPSCTSPAGCPAFDQGQLADFSARVLESIRRVDPSTLVFWEPLLVFDFGAQTSHPDLDDPAAGFSFHNYCLPGAFGGPTGTSCASLEELVFDNADAIVDRTGDVPLLSEFGATDDLETIGRISALADQHMLSWQEWHYCDCEDPTTAGPGVQSVVLDPNLPPRGANLKKAKLRLLARPYPQAVNGVADGWEFDPVSRRFTLSYSTAPIGGEPIPRRVKTKVAVPPINYRHGYRVRLDGGEVRSRRNGPILRIKANRDAESVSLTIVPRRRRHH